MPMNLNSDRVSPRRTVSAVTTLCLALALSGAAVVAQANPLVPMRNLPQPVDAPAHLQIGDENIALITGLLGIERDMLLGQLFLHDGLVSTEGSHFTHPRRDNLPGIKDDLAKAGAPNLEPLLIALEEASGKEAITKAYNGVLGGLHEAKAALHPTEQDLMGAVIATTEAAASMLDPSGTTGVLEYQEAWGLLMVARSQLDALVKSSDPAIKQSASAMALSFDDVVLFAPDPNAKAPVAFDPALVMQLIATLKGEVASI